MTAIAESPAPGPTPGPKPDADPEQKTLPELIVFGVIVAAPLLALIAAVPLAWGWGLGWSDIVIASVFYVVTGLGVTVGLHRHFTHGSFKAKRPLKIALGIAGSLSLEMSVLDWVATHRKHHKFSDKEGDPHSPWRFGPGFVAADQGPALRAHGLAVRDRPDQPREVRARPGQGPGHHQAAQALPRAGDHLAGASRRCSAAC